MIQYLYRLQDDCNKSKALISESYFQITGTANILYNYYMS